MMEERIKARIEALTKARDEYVLAANRQIGAFNGALEALGALLVPEEEQPAEPLEVSPEMASAASGD